MINNNQYKQLISQYKTFNQEQSDIVLIQSKLNNKELMWSTIDQFDDKDIKNSWNILGSINDFPKVDDLINILNKIEKNK